MEISANAKINLCLDVVKRREDGYHEMDMIMSPIDLCDIVSIVEAESDTLTSNDSSMPLDASNTMWKALHVMREEFNFTKHIAMHVQKNIPMEAGMAGGSADAGAVMKGIWEMMKYPCRIEELALLGKKVGADVPFCIMNTCSIVQGIGEKIEPFQNQCQFHVLLVKPNEGVSTKQAFQNLDFTTCYHPATYNCKKALESGDIEAFYKHSGNTLEQSALKLVPAIDTIKKELQDVGFPFVLMSGSGSTVFALCQDTALLHKGYERMKDRYPFVYKTKTL